MHSGPLFRNPTTLFRAPLFRAFSVALRQKCVDLDSGLRKSLWLDTLQIQSAVLWVFSFLLVLVPFKVFPTSLYFIFLAVSPETTTESMASPVRSIGPPPPPLQTLCGVFNVHSLICMPFPVRSFSIYFSVSSLASTYLRLTRPVSCCILLLCA